MKLNNIKAVLIMSILSTSFTTNAELSKHLATTIEPTPIKRVSPKYPINEARAGREGWARLSFIIEKDGSVSNILVNKTSGGRDFAKHSIAAVKRWRYQPALENGEPIQQCVNNVQLDFKMSANGKATITRKFKSLYEKTVTALQDKDYERTQALIEKMENMKHRHLSENNYLKIISADYARDINDKNAQLSHLYNITLADGLLSQQQQLSILNDRFAVEIALNKFQQAHNTFKSLAKLDVAKPHMTKYQSLMDKVNDFIASDENLVINANIEEKDFWQYPLLRNEFSLININGTLHKLDVRCANKRHVYTVEENNTWHLPARWKSCTVYVYGDNYTTFNLVEHPFKSEI